VFSREAKRMSQARANSLLTPQTLQFVFGTYMAQVAEVEVAKDGVVRVRRVVCAVDCGIPVNPDSIRAQIQSPAPHPLRQWLSPVGLFGGKLKDGFGAGRVLEEGTTIGDRVVLRRCRQFVHKTFGHEDIVRRPDAAPESGRNARRFHPYVFDVQIRQRIDQVDRALGILAPAAVAPIASIVLISE
jgi:hypothetical protein